MYLLIAGNDTVPISVWRGEGMHSTECRLVCSYFHCGYATDTHGMMYWQRPRGLAIMVTAAVRLAPVDNE